MTYINEVNQYQDGDLNHAHLYSRVRPDLNPETEVQRIKIMHFLTLFLKYVITVFTTYPRLTLFLVRIAPHWLSLVVQLPWQWLKFLQSTAKENKIEWYNRTYSVPTKDGSSKSFIYHHTQWCGLPWLTSDIPDDLKNDLMLSETSSAQNAISVAEHSRMVRLLRRDHMGTLCWCPVIGGEIL